VLVTGAGGADPWWTEEDEDCVYVLTGDDSYVHGRRRTSSRTRWSDVVLRFADTGADEFYWDTVGHDHRSRSARSSRTSTSPEMPQPDSFPSGVTAITARRVPTDTCEIGPATVERGPPRGGVGAAVGAGDIDRPLGLVHARAMSTSARRERHASPSGSRRAPFAAITAAAPAAVSVVGVDPARPGAAVGDRRSRLPAGDARVLRRNPDDSPVIVQYTAPKDESLTLSAGVLDVPERAMAAHVVDLAVRDAVELRAIGRPQGSR
jgi:hypothetical protein